jgi:hypothetical protein
LLVIFGQENIMPKQSIKKTAKFRPYLSLDELAALVVHLESIPIEEKSHLAFAFDSIRRTATLAGMHLAIPAYVATPRKSLTDRLEFAPTVSPNFEAMMKELGSGDTLL